MSSPVSEKVAIVTGTSSGIGLSTAILLAQAGYRVVATMRNTAKSGPLEKQAQEANVNIDIRQLDVLDDASIEGCVQEVIQSYGRLDLLVNNAGAGYLGTVESTTIETLRDVMETNFFGVWKMTQAVLPTMRVARSGRIINVTSVGGVIGQPFNDAYCAAKFAVEGFSESLAPVVKRLGIDLVLIEPGPVNTEFVGTVQAKLSDLSPELTEAYGPMLNAYLAGTQQAFAAIGQTPADIGRVIVKAATTDTPHLRYTTSDRIRDIVSRKYVDPTGDSVIALTGARLPKL